MRRAWWWGVWVCVWVCLTGAAQGVAECRDAGAKGRVWTPDAKGKDWTWKDADGCVRTRAELDVILRLQRQAAESHAKEGKWADFSGAHLENADLRDASLKFATFNVAYLDHAHLDNAKLFGACLNASLAGADFTGAYLVQVDLDEADLFDANFRNATYEPNKAPTVERIAEVRGLDHLGYRYEQNRIDLAKLKQSFHDAGYERQAKQVSASLHRHDEAWLEKILFDWTCDWGADWSHPLVLLGWLCLICGPVYWVGMHFGRVGGIYQIVLDEVVATKAAKEVVSRVDVGVKWVGWERIRGRRGGLRRRLVAMAWRAEWRALRLAFLFSVLSALDIGFHEFNVGQWARMLLARDFNLKARGWMRVAGGAQSLVGLGLVALSLLSYFGHPFD